MGEANTIFSLFLVLPKMSEAELPVEKRIWYRTTFFNATIVGLGALFAPGLYNAMASTGAGGAQTPYLVSSLLHLRIG